MLCLNLILLIVLESELRLWNLRFFWLRGRGAVLGSDGCWLDEAAHETTKVTDKLLDKVNRRWS